MNSQNRTEHRVETPKYILVIPILLEKRKSGVCISQDVNGGIITYVIDSLILLLIR